MGGKNDSMGVGIASVTVLMGGGGLTELRGGGWVMVRGGVEGGRGKSGVAVVVGAG